MNMSAVRYSIFRVTLYSLYIIRYYAWSIKTHSLRVIHIDLEEIFLPQQITKFR